MKSTKASSGNLVARVWRHPATRWTGLVLAVLLVPVLVFLGVTGYIYFTYLQPNTELPSGLAEVGEAAPVEPGFEALALRADSLLSSAMARASLPSISAAVGRGERTLWARATGMADVEKGRPAQIDSRYRLGSVCKPVTGTLIARLVQQGRLDLDAPIGRYVPDLPDHLHAVTARQLATHQAGIRHYKGLTFAWPPYDGLADDHYGSVSEALAVFQNDDLLFDPGTSFRYSTYGYTLLSRALEVAGDQDFLALLKAEVLTRVGMHDTSSDDARREIPQRVAFYETGENKYVPSYPVDTSVKWAGGGLVGSPSDVVRLALAAMGDSLLTAEARQIMWTPQPLADGTMNPQNYALGWRVDVSEILEINGEMARIIHHGGLQTGGAAILVLLPDYDFAVAVMTNSGSGAARREVQEVAYALARIFLDS